MLDKIIVPIYLFVGLGVMSGILLSVFSKIFSVKTDERVENIILNLPGLNCGACGFSGCENYAQSIVKDNTSTNKCIPGGEETSKKLSDIIGISFENVVKNIAYVSCNGKVPNATSSVYDYSGENTCVACNTYYQGKGTCKFSCLGYGDCVKKCNYGAISIIDNVSVIDANLCVGCTLCVASCPKGIINMRSEKNKVFVACSSCDIGKISNQNCKNSCIACKKCENICKYDAIKVIDNIAIIDYDKCTSCGDCVTVCPKKCIHVA